MGQRHRRRIFDPAGQRAKLAPTYLQAKEWQHDWPPGSPAYWKNDALLTALNELAETLTGERLSSDANMGPSG